ncbi:MAG: hypothetical protein EZS28_012950 [Streblomastix strix]|uniref:Uncharacterized protein n=1 Tax=Streblomastix strix TaxID=222440 RepID=A0A5J4W9D1_9EUKA|nr:MAG: hypothetical protein EZS28_012950 [Streblomastix strix]
MREQASDLWGGHFSKMSKNSIKPEPTEPGLFANFDTPKITAKTPVTATAEKPELRDEIGKFLQSAQHPTLQDIERQLTPRQAVSERTQTFIAKVLEAITGAQASERDFWATNILDEKNGEALRRELLRPSLLPITSVPVPDEVLDSQQSPIIGALERTTITIGNRYTQLDNLQLKEGRENALCKTTKRNGTNGHTCWEHKQLQGETLRIEMRQELQICFLESSNWAKQEPRPKFIAN